MGRDYQLSYKAPIPSDFYFYSSEITNYVLFLTAGAQLYVGASKYSSHRTFKIRYAFVL
jgi:hypothetical protein